MQFIIFQAAYASIFAVWMQSTFPVLEKISLIKTYTNNTFILFLKKYLCKLKFKTFDLKTVFDFEHKYLQIAFKR